MLNLNAGLSPLVFHYVFVVFITGVMRSSIQRKHKNLGYCIPLHEVSRVVRWLRSDNPVELD